MGHRVNYCIFTDKPEYVPHLSQQKGKQIIIRCFACWRVSPRTAQRPSAISPSSASSGRWLTSCVRMWTRASATTWAWRSSPPCSGLSISPTLGSIRPTSPMNASLSHVPIFLKMRGLLFHRGLIGGSVSEVYRLTRACHETMTVDQANHIKAVWHDESRLNKYLLSHKPSKVLSP